MDEVDACGSSESCVAGGGSEGGSWLVLSELVGSVDVVEGSPSLAACLPRRDIRRGAADVVVAFVFRFAIVV